MAEKSRFRENIDSLWENRRKLAVLTVFGIIAVLYFSRNSGSTTVVPSEFAGDYDSQSTETIPLGSASSESSQPQPGQPDFVDLGQSGIYGITNGMVYGVIPVQCATVNFRHSAFSDGDIIDPKYESDQPPIEYAGQALDILGMEQSTVSANNQVYVARGSAVVPVVSMLDHAFNMLNNDARICVEVVPLQ